MYGIKKKKKTSRNWAYSKPVPRDTSLLVLTLKTLIKTVYRVVVLGAQFLLIVINRHPNKLLKMER